MEINNTEVLADVWFLQTLLNSQLFLQRAYLGCNNSVVTVLQSKHK